MKFKLSIIIVSITRKKIGNAISSVISQTYDDWELIVVNGNSTDMTDYVVKNYEKNIAHYINEPDSGIYNAMNKGASLASGTHISFLNSDDVYYPNFVEKLYKAYKEFDANFFAASIELVSKDNKHVGIVTPINNHERKDCKLYANSTSGINSKK